MYMSTLMTQSQHLTNIDKSEYGSVISYLDEIWQNVLRNSGWDQVENSKIIYLRIF